MNQHLTAGWAEADITPEGRVVALAGQYYPRVATELHSRLKATVLVLEQAGGCSAFAALDVVGVPADMAQRLSRAIAAAVAPLSPDRVIINATHTHTAPALSQARRWPPVPPQAITGDQFLTLLETALVAAARQAWDGRQPAGVAGATEFVPVGHCRQACYLDGTAEMYGATRRDDFAGIEGGEDAGVELLFLADASRQPLGVIVNLACPAQVMEAAYKISSDFTGALREKLKTTFGPSFRTLPQISAAGCQSPRDLTRHDQLDLWREAGVERIADRLASAVRRAWPDAAERIDFTPPLHHQRLRLDLPKRRATEADHRAAKQEIERLEAKADSASAYRDFCEQVKANEMTPGRPGPYDDKHHPFVRARNAQAVIDRYEEQARSSDVTVDLHLLRLGHAVFATNPFELYLEFGQRIKARSHAAQTLIVQLANGYEGYLPSARAERHGGYGGLIINGKVGSEGGQRLANATVKAMSQLIPTPPITRVR
jgi:hypothetical protein